MSVETIKCSFRTIIISQKKNMNTEHSLFVIRLKMLRQSVSLTRESILKRSREGL